jgi:hypothetical protein
VELINAWRAYSEAHLGIKYAGNPSNNSLPDVFHQGSVVAQELFTGE